MTTTITITEAKSQLSRLIREIQDGGQIVIGNAGKPVAILTAYSETQERRELGGWEHEDVWIADDFNAPLPDDLQAAFEGRTQ
jgi:prevent-host-death family protein